MNWFTSLFQPKVATRSAPTTWDLIRSGGGIDTVAGVPVGPHLAENLSVVFACVQVISETIGALPLGTYRRLGDGARELDTAHPVARLFSDGPNEFQTASEFIEMMTAHCLLRGNSYAEIVRDGRGAPMALTPYHPDWVSLVRIRPGRYAYDVSMPEGGTRRLLPEEMLHLRDRSDDGIIGRSRLSRAREVFGTAMATERYAQSTFKNGAAMSGVLSHPEALGDEAAERLRKSFEATYSGVDRAGRVAVLEEGLKWQQVSVSPDDCQALQSRQFSVAALARIFRVPPPIIGTYEGGNYSSIVEIHRIFYSHCISPWLNRWERVIERSLFSEEGRRTHEVEFDADLLMRTNMLERYQAYRIAREIGLASANELRKWEHLNPRTDEAGDKYFEPANMQQEQTGRPRDDRGADDA